MKSVWNDGVERVEFPSMNGDKKTDVLIIGGGMAGLLCAYMLKRNGVDCILVEADRICGGVTGYTTAKITLQHGLIYRKIVSRFGWEKAELYLKAQGEACNEYARLCREIDCDYEIRDSLVYSTSDRWKIESEIAALERLSENAEFVSDLPIPVKVVGAVKIKDQAQFNPLKFAFKIAEDLPIHEHTKVREILPGGVLTNRGKIRAERIIVATHFPLLNKHGGYFLKLYQHRSYVLALDGAGQANGMYVDENEKGLSFRNYNDLLLLGGGSHRTGKNGGAYYDLQAFAGKFYPQADIFTKWATQDCMTLDDLPYIGRYSRNTPDIFVATGFNKWGMSSSMLSAMMLSDLVVDKQNDYAEVFSPSRSILHPKLALNACESILGLITPTTPRCPHLGCALKYNSQEHTWDCPCHGSRFTDGGKLINNPATDDLKKHPKR